MSEEKQVNVLPKYRVIWSSTDSDLEDKMNALAEVGYALSHFGYDAARTDESNDVYHAVMSLRSSPDLQNAGDVVNVEKDTNMPDGTPMIRKMVADGWVVLSEYAKVVCLIKPKDKSVPKRMEASLS